MSNWKGSNRSESGVGSYENMLYDANAAKVEHKYKEPKLNAQDKTKNLSLVDKETRLTFFP